jgi:hypothetical protein
MANHESDDEWWGTTDDEKSKLDHLQKAQFSKNSDFQS